MQGADLSKAQMQEADLRWTQMDTATSLNADTLRGAAFKGLDYTDVSLSQAQVDEVFYDGSVRFAEGINRAPDREATLDWEDFETQWHDWQKSIGYDPK